MIVGQPEDGPLDIEKWSLAHTVYITFPSGTYIPVTFRKMSKFDV